MKHFHSLRTLVVVMVSIALGTCAYAGNGDNSTPGGCSDTYYGCNNEGEQHDPNDPNSVFSYEQSCVWCVTDRDREVAAVLYGELGYVPEEPPIVANCEESAHNWLAFGASVLGVAYFVGMVDDSGVLAGTLGTVGSGAVVYGGVKLLVCKLIE